MTTTITILLVLGLAAWVAWRLYGRYWWGARKWEQELRKAQARLEMEDKAARVAQEAKDAQARYLAADLQHRAEELKWQRTEENLIYEDMRSNDDQLIRRLVNRRTER